MLRARGTTWALAFAFLGLVAAGGAGSAQDAGKKKERSGLAEDDSAIALTAAVRSGGTAKLFPEQSPSFDLALENKGKANATVLSLDLNPATPVFNVLDSDGQVLHAMTHHDADARTGDDLGEPVDESHTVALAPGGSEKTWVSLGRYGDPLPKGRYAFEAKHQLRAESENVIKSNRVPFEVVDAKVESCALGYDSSQRLASSLAWLASPLEGGDPQLLVRVSGFGSHLHAQSGAASHGVVPRASLLSVSELVPGKRASFAGWIAVISGSRVELVRHNKALPNWRSGPLSLPITDVRPIPRFPDRIDHVVFLATGKSDGAPTLAGLSFRRGDTSPRPWTVPLASTPVFAVCTAPATGPIPILVVSEEGKTTRISRLDVDETGVVDSAEKVVRTTPNRVLAVVADTRGGVPPAFFVLEADRDAADKVASVYVPVARPPEAHDLAPLAGWPAKGEGEKRRLLAVKEVSLEVGEEEGTLSLALVSEDGSLYGGMLDGPSPSLARLREGAGPARAMFPQAVAFRPKNSFSCFTETGALFHGEGH